METVIAIIVTFNRLELLKEAVLSVKLQTAKPASILIVNNGCTDGTALWLSQQEGIEVLTLQENGGASMGFYRGIKEGLSHESAFLWLMDDDTICEPDTLEQLLANADKISGKIGFIGSRCKWKDGEPHLMNVPNIQPMFNKVVPFNKYDQLGLLLTASSSWVSILVNVDAIREVGLPYKEFFFWSDDLEYTQRITKAGYLGFYSINSIVLHNTIANYFADFCTETPNNIWKHETGFRNEFFMKKKEKGLLYFSFWLPAKIAYTSYKVIKIRKDNHLKFIGVLLQAAWKSILFNPKIDKA